MTGPALVVNLRYDACDVYGGKGSPLGNKYTTGRTNRNTAIQRFREAFYARIAADPAFRTYVLGLAGQRLGCHCKPKACHLDVVAEYINRELNLVQPEQAKHLQRSAEPDKQGEE